MHKCHARQDIVWNSVKTMNLCTIVIRRIDAATTVILILYAPLSSIWWNFGLQDMLTPWSLVSFSRWSGKRVEKWLRASNCRWSRKCSASLTYFFIIFFWDFRLACDSNGIFGRPPYRCKCFHEASWSPGAERQHHLEVEVAYASRRRYSNILTWSYQLHAWNVCNWQHIRKGPLWGVVHSVEQIL